MKWLKRKLYKWATEGDRLENQVCIDEGPYPVTGNAKIRGVDTEDLEPNLRMNIINAIGGKIIKFISYDHKTDRRNERLYIITEDEDFNESLSKIITMESMKQ